MQHLILGLKIFKLEAIEHKCLSLQASAQLG